MNEKFGKNEHLKKDSQIKYLFETGNWCYKFPLKIIYTPSIQFLEKNHKIGVSVSKRNFKRSVDRNYIKRLLRECYRLNKQKLNEVFKKPHFIMIIYSYNEKLSYQELQKQYLLLLDKIEQEQKKELS